MLGRGSIATVSTRAILLLVREHGFTQRMIARGLGVSESYISRLMKDPTKLQEFVARLGEHPALTNFVRALEDPGFRSRLRARLAFVELNEERNSALVL